MVAGFMLHDRSILLVKEVRVMADFMYYNEFGEGFTEYEAHVMFDDMLDDVYGDIYVGVSIPASRVLKECDPIAYRVGFSDYADAMISDGVWFEEDPTGVEDE